MMRELNTSFSESVFWFFFMYSNCSNRSVSRRWESRPRRSKNFSSVFSSLSRLAYTASRVLNHSILPIPSSQIFLSFVFCNYGRSLGSSRGAAASWGLWWTWSRSCTRWPPSLLASPWRMRWTNNDCGPHWSWAASSPSDEADKRETTRKYTCVEAFSVLQELLIGFVAAEASERGTLLVGISGNWSLCRGSPFWMISLLSSIQEITSRRRV